MREKTERKTKGYDAEKKEIGREEKDRGKEEREGDLREKTQTKKME